MPYSKQLRYAVALLYVAYAGAIITTWSIDKYLYETVIACLGLHFAGLAVGYAQYGFASVYLIGEADSSLSFVLLLWDFCQLVLLVLMLMLGAIMIEITAVAALIGVVLCLIKAYFILHDSN